MRRWGALFVAATLSLAGLSAMRPADGATKPAVASDELVETLNAAGPTDQIVVFVRGESLAAAKEAVAASGLRLVTLWEVINVAVAQGTPTAIHSVVSQPGVVYVEPDGPLVYHLDTAHQATRADEARTLAQLQTPSGGPYDGSGVSIAINDSGVDGAHEMFTRPDGTSKVALNVRELCHNAVCSGGTVEVSDPFFPPAANNSDIVNGHGTHVAGIAAGFERTTLDGRTVRGAAPGATLVAHGSGVGLSIAAATSGLEWVYDNRLDPCGDGSCPPIRVVNNSWGGGPAFNPNSATTLIVNALVDAGVVVVFSAGNGDTTNNGGDGSTNLVNGHAWNPKPGVIGVANYDDAGLGTRDGSLAPSSSRGLRTDPATYPDISAPGSLIVSACTYALPICRSNGDVTDPNYAEISGTSMSAPNIAGVVAVLLQANPSLSPAQVEDVIEDTAYQFGDATSYVADAATGNADHTTSFDKGHGLVDVVAALGDARVLNVTTPTGPTCASGGQIFDSAGDATQVIVPTGAPGQLSEPGLDIISGNVSTDATTGDLTFQIEVMDLDDLPPAGSLGEHMRFYFTFEGTEYLVSAWRSRAGAVTVSQGARLEESVLLGQVIAAGLAVEFNTETDTISIVVPNEAINTWKPTVPVIETGDQLTGLEILAQRREGVGVGLTGTFTADTAAGACPYIVAS